MICPHCQREIADNSNFCYYCGSRQPAVGGPRAGSTAPRRRMMRSALDQKLAGVCGGMADYFEMDSTLMRLLWVLITFFTGIVPGIVVYVVAWMIMPLAPLYVAAAAAAQQNSPTPAG
jgi:phage shock protein C